MATASVPRRGGMMTSAALVERGCSLELALEIVR
jgi:hypothetical protein